MSEIDDLWRGVCRGDRDTFGDWMGRVERPIRHGLAAFAHAVDIESVMQETLLRMWLFAQDRGAGLAGEHASLRFAIGVARNLARNIARKQGRELLLPPHDLPEMRVDPDPVPDPFLARAIRECLEQVAERPLQALRARIDRGGQKSDRDLAKAVGMTVNTFLQNIVRARRQVAACLEGRGVRLHETGS